MPAGARLSCGSPRRSGFLLQFSPCFCVGSYTVLFPHKGCRVPSRLHPAIGGRGRIPQSPPRRHRRPRLRSSRDRAGAGRGARGDGEAGPGAPPRAEDGGREARRRLPQRPEGRPAAGSRRAAAGLRAPRGAGGPSPPQPGAGPAGPASPRQVRKRRAAARSRGPGQRRGRERRRCRPRAGKLRPGRALWGGPAPPGGDERAASRRGGGGRRSRSVPGGAAAATCAGRERPRGRPGFCRAWPTLRRQRFAPHRSPTDAACPTACSGCRCARPAPLRALCRGCAGCGRSCRGAGSPSAAPLPLGPVACAQRCSDK